MRTHFRSLENWMAASQDFIKQNSDTFSFIEFSCGSGGEFNSHGDEEFESSVGLAVNFGSETD